MCVSPLFALSLSRFLSIFATYNYKVSFSASTCGSSLSSSLHHSLSIARFVVLCSVCLCLCVVSFLDAVSKHNRAHHALVRISQFVYTQKSTTVTSKENKVREGRGCENDRVEGVYERNEDWSGTK